MKRFTGSVALSAVVLASSPVLAADLTARPAADGPVQHWLAFAGVDANSAGTFFAYSGFQYAPGKGGLEESGLRFWLLGGGGAYHYLSANDEKIRGTFYSTDALVGYSFERDDL